MAKIIIIPDSFKGSMTSSRVADILGDVIQNKTENEIVKIPIADGGEGSTECILKSLGGRQIRMAVHSPENELIEAMYGILPDDTAVVEIAESSGITKQTSYNACGATTYGFGELILSAVNQGVRKFLICLGGSATTDCGCGMAAALGVRFYDFSGNEFVPTGGSLADVARIDTALADPRIKECTFKVMSDVENPLYGENGAAYVYGPQKGAGPDDVIILDNGLKHVSKIMEEAGLVSCEHIKGAGAAGGVGYGCAAFLGAEIVSGIHAMLDICGYDDRLKDTSLIVTGEGRLDDQSLMGKVLSGILERSKGKSIVTFCGICTADIKKLKQENVSVVEIGRGRSVEDSIKNAEKYLREAAEAYFEAGLQ